MIFGGWQSFYHDTMAFLEFLQERAARSRATIPLFFLSVIITWFVYVPIHELMHVAGCIATGGTVSELVMGREYGADFLQHIFPFIVPQTTQYAGRLTGFSPSADFGYFVTDIAPFLLTIFPGVILYIHAVRQKKLWLTGPGLVIGLAPFINLTGDYFEMGTIISTRVINILTRGASETAIEGFWAMRSDDIFRLLGEIAEDTGRYGFNSASGSVMSLAVIIVGLILAIWLCGVTYGLGRRFYTDLNSQK